VTVRVGPRVRKQHFADAEPALAALRAGLDGAERLDTSSVLGREYAPSEQVSARGEIRGPSRRRAGADVHGDGSVEAWTGWLRRRALEPRDGETAWDALLREVRGA
jgi:hypothetical protein